MPPARYLESLHRTLLLLLFLATAVPAQGAVRVLDSIDVNVEDDRAVVRIAFTRPLRPQAWAPRSEGDTLQIQLQPVASAVPDDADLQGSETLAWQPSAAVPLQEVRYDGSGPDGPGITLRFLRPVSFQVAGDADFRSLTVTIPLPRTAAPPVIPAATATAAATGSYVVNLESARSPLRPDDRAELAGLGAYVTRFMKDGVLWYRLRVGPFADRAEAQALLQRLHGRYPQAWLDQAGPDDRGLAAPAPAAAPTGGPLAALMAEARGAMTRGAYRHAAALYTKVLGRPDSPYRRDAQELLALALERNGQFARAKAEYENYLRLYPEGEGAARVRQRLAGLVTARQAPKAALRSPDRRPDAPQWQVFGGFSQFYRRDVSTVGQNDTTVNQSSLASDLDVTGRLRGPDYELRTRFTGGYLYDFLPNGPGSVPRISALYVEGVDRRRGLSGSLGRQSMSTGGVLGRFDGGRLSYQLSPRVKLNVVAGYPVELFTSNGVSTDKYFYGVSTDLGSFGGALDVNLFAIRQLAAGILDREAVGGEVRYFRPTRSFFGLVDYDTHYRELNTFLALGNWTLPDRTTLNMLLDYRQSPVLTTSNAIIGQPVTNLQDLLATHTTAELEALARDRTARSRSATLGLTHPLSERLQISGDVTVSGLSGTPASGGVAVTDATGNEMYYNVQLIGSSLLKAGDIAILGLRYSDASTSRTVSLLLNTRYPLSDTLRINPRLRLDRRQDLRSDSLQWSLLPSLRLTYRMRRDVSFDAEAGGEWSNRQLTTTTEQTRGYYLNIGYRKDF